jgi:hypothetical protein
MGKNRLMYLSRTFACFYANQAGVLQAKYQEFYPKAEIVASYFFRGVPR